MEKGNIGTILDASSKRVLKDSLFRFLFGIKDLILELYNAVRDTHYGLDSEVSLITLENPLYTTRLNDLSFILDNKLVVMIEHQSTINENIPLRMLLYIAKTYEQWTDDLDIYRKNMLTIPHPEFIVLYNGTKEMDDMVELNLSDMFAEQDIEYPVNLELTVRVYNINKGRNPDMAKRSATLDGYEIFIAKCREYAKIEGVTPEQAVDRATEDCIREGILTEFLKTYRSEVRNMLTTEWKLEDAMMVSKMEGREEGEERRAKRIALKMKEDGKSIEEIVRFTDLTVDDILRL
ncbi:MAG: Rpn family recombination-promoting nuclease/putative transposase [Chitinispirillia bacterium]|nr:Rpn family recombination-promoting nuclease/putative transposase [Chitinispirillia bacterium]